MKKQEKTELTRERILIAALKEFGTKGYAAASLNTICAEHGIAKGLIYHNFEGKDALYLACVDRCLKEVTAFLRENAAGIGLREYLALRFRFFSANPICARIFFEAVLQPPDLLQEEIRALRADFKELNRGFYKRVLAGLTLRPGVTEQDALDYYELLQEMFNGCFSSSAYSGGDFPALVLAHEEKLEKVIDYMLYGIAQGGESL